MHFPVSVIGNDDQMPRNTPEKLSSNVLTDDFNGSNPK